MGAGSLTLSRSRRTFRTAYLHFILIDHWYSLHSGLRCTHAFCVMHFICRVCGVNAYHMYAKTAHHMHANKFNITCKLSIICTPNTFVSYIRQSRINTTSFRFYLAYYVYAFSWDGPQTEQAGCRWVTEQNKDGAKCGCAVLEERSTRCWSTLSNFKWQMSYLLIFVLIIKIANSFFVQPTFFSLCDTFLLCSKH